jgi:hypothetical protein
MARPKNPSPKFGIVVLLDALGAKTTTLEDTLIFFRSFRKILREIRSAQVDSSEINFTIEQRVFGDSILLTVPVAEPDKWKQERERNPRGAYSNLQRCFDLTVETVNEIVALGINEQILFRGAVAIGEYVAGSDTILGPAVSDAASWYEEGDFVGVFATPYTTTYVERMLSKTGNKDRLKLSYYRCQLPLKGSSRDCGELYLLDWARSLKLISGNHHEDPERWFYDMLARRFIPKGVESKFFNTESLLKRSMSRKQSK